MNEKLASLWNKVVEHKEAVIRTTAIVVGAGIGIAIAAVVINNQSESFEEEAELEEVADEE